jgi:hypothetical protein
MDNQKNNIPVSLCVNIDYLAQKEDWKQTFKVVDRRASL